MRKLTAVVLALSWIMMSLSQAFPGFAFAASRPPDLRAKAAALIDVASGRILYSKNGERPMRIASLTKIMTAIVAIENGRMSDMVTVQPNAAGVEGSSIYLKKGEKISLENLLYGLMLRSGNDAAVAIADHVGGSVDGFVYMMNREAARLGLSHTHFANPNGLDAKGHVSTADDMARLTAYALHNPVFRNIVKTRVKTVPNPDGKWDWRWRNKNKMLVMYKGADGVKTGYTKLAKRCLVSSATRGSQQLAVVTLNDPDDWADHERLLNYGFSQYPLKELVQKGQRIQGHPDLTAARTFEYPLSTEEQKQLSMRVTKEPRDSLNYRLGYRGQLQFMLNSQWAGTVMLLPSHPAAGGTGESAGGPAEAQQVATKKSHTGFARIYRLILHRLFLDSAYR